MRKKEVLAFQEELKARVNKRGRPKGAQVNIITLDPNGKGRGYLVPIGDLHWGAETCNEQKVLDTLKYCWDRKIPIIGMGDWMECGLSDSVGDSVYTQTLNPQKQFDELVELFQPFADAGLLSGIHAGNHEERISQRVGLDITRQMARILGVRLFDDGQFHLIRCGKQSYTAWSHHGASGARLPYTKIKGILDTARWVSAELHLMGHVHSLDSITQNFYMVDKRNKRVIRERRTFVLTGHFLEYRAKSGRGSYAAKKLMIPSKTGVAKVCFDANEHKINVSI